MEVMTLVEKAKQAGLNIRVSGDSLEVAGKPTPEALTVVRELKEHKVEVIALLRRPIPSLALPKLQDALKQKEEEIAYRKRCLESPYYSNDAWTKDRISKLTDQIGEIDKYLKEGGNLTLPVCKNKTGSYCLLALYGFDACSMLPGDCGFSLEIFQERVVGNG